MHSLEITYAINDYLHTIFHVYCNMNIFIVNRLKPINQTLPVVVFHAALHHVRLFLAEKLGQLLRLCVHHHLPFYLGLYVDILSLLAFSAPGIGELPERVFPLSFRI